MSYSVQQAEFRNDRSAELQPERVLLVDDSSLQRKILSASLERWGFDVVEAESGEHAVALCQNFLPDVVICDWVMTGMTGLQFCEEFRRLTRDQYGYFILLTSKAEKAEVAEGLQSGADDFLTKPVNSHELRARIAAGQRILAMQRESLDSRPIQEYYPSS